MTSVQTFRSPHSLLISYVDVQEQLYILSPKPGCLNQEMIKTAIRKNIRFSVYNGKLFIKFVDRHGDSPSLRLNFEPHHAGSILRFIHPKSIGIIESFLQENFGTIAVNELSLIEKDQIHEVQFFNNRVTDAEKEELSNLLLKLITIAFPVYINYVDNRISDGFYSNYGFNVYNKPYFRARTFRELLVEAFGCYRKDLAKEVVTCNAITFDWASQFSNLLEIDHIINGLREGHRMTEGISGSLSAIQNFPPSIIHRLFLEGLRDKDFDTIIVQDALNMAESIPVEEHKLCRTWKELHDRGVMHYVHDETGYTAIPHPPIFEEFFKHADFGNRHVVPLRDSEDFIKTGKYMDVCVGTYSYIKKAIDGDGYCFRVDNDDKEKYALIEVTRNSQDKWNINQVKGHSNADLPKDFHKELFEQLSKYIPLESRK